MILIIAEKKELALAICEALPEQTVKEGYHFKSGNYVVAYLAGHALELLQPNEIDEKYKNWKAEDLPIFFRPWPKKIIESKIKLVSDVGEFLKKCEYVIHAGDNDDEGQYLVDEVLEHFKYTGKVMRLDTANTSKPALEKSLKNMTDNAKHMSAGKAAEARQLSDALFGYSLSRHFSIVNHAKLTVGRVQTPTLGLVVQRDALIDGHSKTFYYELFGNFAVEDICIKAKFHPSESSNILDDGKRCLNESSLEDVQRSVLGKTFQLDISIKEEKEAAPLPFNLVKLQTYANKKFGYSPNQVMEITQSLRDNHKAITYNRSDCQYLSEEHFEEAPETVAKVLSNIGYDAQTYDIDTSIKSKCFNSKYVTLHFAIIPTAISLDISKLSQDELNIYKAISERYLMQFIPPLRKDAAVLSVVTEFGLFKARESKVKYSGYTALSSEIDEDDGDDEEKADVQDESSGLLALGEGQHTGVLKTCNIEKKETKPPKRYTLASLNEDLTRIVKYVKDPKIKAILLRKDDGKKGENGSIGTSATRASIIDNLLKRGYLEMKGKSVISTELGKKFYSILPDSIKFADTTAVWWLHQEAIIAGTENSSTLTDSVLEVVNDVIDTCKEQKIQSSSAREPVGRCPKCTADVVHVDNPKLKAYCCSNKDCKFILWETQYGSKLSESNAKLLLDGKLSAKMKFKSKAGKSYEARLKLTGEKVELVFNQSSPRGKSGSANKFYAAANNSANDFLNAFNKSLGGKK